MRGELDAGEYAREISLVRERIAASDAPHWREFLAPGTREPRRLEKPAPAIGHCRRAAFSGPLR